MKSPIVYKNLSAESLFDHAVIRTEGVVASNGALCVSTGERTGRSPKDRFIVKGPTTANTVDWGAVNQPLHMDDFEKLWADALASLNQYDIYEKNYQVGAHPHHHITVNVRCNYAWHTLFADCLFINPPQPLKETQWQLVNAEHLVVEGSIYNLPGKAAVVLDFEKKRILICGTLYAGEMKKAMFSVMNFLMPDQDVLPMHCSANREKTGANRPTCLFFGLSGTGKTTLSADPDRLLIGDDEHGWGPDGIFNFEGGCYAKCIRLSKENEPLIWNALKNGAVIENVVLGDQGVPNYDDDSITENTRAAYPLDFIPERDHDNVHPHPISVVFLTCDLYGVLPPVSKLLDEQIEYYFLSGYTALVGNTEVGHTKAIQPTFSMCFGAPFFSRPPQVYAQLLTKRINETGAEVYLVNTGWYGGAYGQGGQRFPIKETRKIVTAITNGSIKQCQFEKMEPFGLHIPKTLGNIPLEILNPILGWKDQSSYHKNAQELIELFEKNAKAKSLR